MPEWIWSGVVGVVVVGLVSFIWRNHENHDQERDVRIWDQVGRDSESGMRRTVHNSANELMGHRGDLKDLEHRMGRVERFLNGKLK